MDDSEGLPDARLASQVGSTVTPSLDSIAGAYRPLLDRIERECFQVLRAAVAEAESLRMAARDEYHRIVSAAHQERSRMLKDAADSRAALYAELDIEIAARVEETERQQALMLAAAEAAATDLRKTAVDEARVQVRAELGVTDVFAIGPSPDTAASRDTVAPGTPRPGTVPTGPAGSRGTVAPAPGSGTVPSRDMPTSGAVPASGTLAPPEASTPTSPAQPPPSAVGLGGQPAAAAARGDGGGEHGEQDDPSDLDRQIFARVAEAAPQEPVARPAPPEAVPPTAGGQEPKGPDRRNPFRRRG